MEAENVEINQEKSELQINLKKKLAEPTVLDSFTKLTSDKEKIRLNAGVKLIKHLIQDSDKTETEQNYALDRLVRGVGSSKLNSKTGFYTVLVSFLQNTATITVDNVLQAINKHLSTGGSNSKSENADICTGQILATGALIHSRKFYSATEEEQKKIVEILITAGNKRSYLSLAAYTFLIEILHKCEDNQFHNTIWPVIKAEISKPWQEQNLDTIYFLSVARGLYQNVVKQKFLNKTLNSPEIIHEDSMKDLCEILLNVSMFTSIKHPIYDYIGKQLAESEFLPTFCSEVDKQLTKSTRNKHLVATHLFTIILQNLSDYSQIPTILTNQFIIVTLNTYKNTRPKAKDDFVIYMTKFFEILEITLKKDEVATKMKISVLKKLLFYPGILIFEKITRTKLIQHITLNLNEDGVKKLAKVYKEVILATKPRVINENRTETWFNTDRVYAANLLVKLIGHTAVLKETDWKLEQAKFLLKLGLFKTDSESNVGVELAASLKECFYRILDLKFPKLEDLRNFLSALIHHIDEEIFQNNNTDLLRTQLPDEGVQIWSDMLNLITKLEKPSKKSKKKNLENVVPVFHTLLLQMGMQLLSDFSMGESALKELQSCYERLNSEKRSNETEGEEPSWIEVVIDLFLSLLSQNSHLLRSVIGCVFPYLCPLLNVQSIHQILEVLDPKNEDNPLTKSKKGDDESDSDGENDSEDASDEENSEKSVESDISDIDEEELDQEQETATDKLRMAVRDALHQNGYQTDDESIDLDQIDEEEGKKLDEALAEAFRNVKKSKGKNSKQSKDDKTLTHFRVRVLDLIEMYLDSEPSLLLSLEIAIMLLQVLEFSIRDIHQKPLENRVRSCLKKLTVNKKFNSIKDVTDQILHEMLNSFIEKGSKSAFIYQDMEKEISECVLFIIRASNLILKENQPENPITPKKLKKKILGSPIVEVLKGALQNFFVKRDSLIPIVLFKRILEYNWEGNYAFVPFLVDFSFDNDIRPFRRSQALELLKIFYNNHRLRLSDPDDFKKRTGSAEVKLNEATIKLFKDENLGKVKEKFVCQLLNLLFAIRNCGENDNFDWESIGNLVREYRSHTTLSKDAKVAYSKLCHSLKIPAAVKMQLKTNGHQDDDNGNDDTQSEASQNEEKILKKRKKNSKKAKLKKETQALRMQANSAGLENDFDFSSVPLDNIESKEDELNLDNSDADMENGFQEKDSDSEEDSEDNKRRSNKKLGKKRNNSTSKEEKVPKKKKKKNRD